MKNLFSVSKKITAIVTLIAMLPIEAFSASTSVLKPDDFVGISFWAISMALVAATAFFFLETNVWLESGKRR